MKYIFITLLLSCSAMFAQEKATISGYVKDNKNGESLIGAIVHKPNSNIGVATNEYGFFSLTLPKGEHIISASLVGYQTTTFTVNLDNSITKNFELTEDSKNLDEVIVLAEAEDKNVKSIEMSIAKLDIKQITKIPALLGEADVLRAIQLLPGVTSVGEGASGFNVRGGNNDQNLILLDEAPVYNSSHLFGFFSVFNPDAVKDVKLIKGGIPSQYGGRVSSILDVRTKEGNNKNLAIQGGIGTIFSRLSIEAPLIKNKASFIVAARRSYLDALVKPFASSTSVLKQSTFYFYDITAKFNYRINDKNTFFLSGYFGRDVFGQPGQLGQSGLKMSWGNTTATARWNHVVNKKLFMNVTAFLSNYNYQLGFPLTSIQGFNWSSTLNNYGVKADFIYYLNDRNTLRYGVQGLLYDLLPYSATSTLSNNTVNYTTDKRYGAEYAAYVGNEQKLSKKITLEYGVRVSMYNYIGPGMAYYYKDTTPNTQLRLTNTKSFNAGQLINSYLNPQPRFSLNYLLTKSSSIKISYNRMVQYIQLISNTASSSPLDIYTIASNNLKPLIADQGCLGYFKNFKDNMYETSVEGYFKYLQNQLDYIDNANLFLNPTVESQLVQGLGRAYGAEFYLRKTKGRLQGWVSYTLSRTERLVRGISNDEWFLSRYDRTHNFNSSLNYDITKRWNISANFVYMTGVPETFPNSKLQVQTLSIPYNTTGTRNNYRITPYNRLDIGATFSFKKNDVRRYKQTLVFSIYNVYNRRNAYSIYFTAKDGQPLQTEAVRYSIIGSIIPGITYNFKF